MTSSTSADAERSRRPGRERWIARWSAAAGPLAAAVFWLAVWQGLALLIGQRILLVGPWEVAVRLVELLPTGEFWQAVARTFARIALGFLLGALAGTVLAAAAARWRLVDTLVSPLMSVIRAVPVVSFIILVLIWASSAQLATIISFLMVLPILYANVTEGIRHRDRALREMAEVFRVPRWRRVPAIDLPDVLPYFVAGCKTGVGLAWKSGIAAEVIGLPAGTIGERLYQAKIFLQTADVFAWTVVVVVLSFALEKVMLWLLAPLERRLSGSVTA